MIHWWIVGKRGQSLPARGLAARPMADPLLCFTGSPDQRQGLFAQALRSVALLSLIAASVTLYGQQMYRGKWVDAFIQSNQLEPPDRRLLLTTMLITAGVGALVPSVWMLVKRSERAVRQVRRVSHALCPLALAAVVPAIFRWKPWLGDRSVYLVWAIGAFVLVLERTLLVSFEAVPDRVKVWADRLVEGFKSRRPRVTVWTPLLMVIGAALFYGVFAAAMQLRLHHRLATASFDLGNYESLFYNALNGHPMRMPACYGPSVDWSSLRGHAELSVFFFTPIYAIRPDAETLIWMQSAIIGIGAIPLYLLASRHLNRWVAMVLAFCYLLYPPLHSSHLFEFHWQPIAAVLVFWALYLLDLRWYLAFAVVFIIALGCREDVSIGLTVAGLFYLFSGYRPVAGAVMAAAAAGYFVLVRFYVQPYFGSWWFQDMYKDLFPQGDPSFAGVVKTLISNPVYVFSTLMAKEKLEYLLRIFLPLAFLPVRRTYLWALFVPAVLGTVLTTGYGPTISTTFQYVSQWVAYIFPAAIVALVVLARQGRIRLAAAAITMTVATVATSYNWGMILQRNNFFAGFGQVNLAPVTRQERERLARLYDLARQIPPGATLAASENEHPHMSKRLAVYTLRYGANDADYIVYRTDSGSNGATEAHAQLDAGAYRVVATRGEFELLERINK